jgi:phospholipid-binding lipoprotein MlaA
LKRLLLLLAIVPLMGIVGGCRQSRIGGEGGLLLTAHGDTALSEDEEFDLFDEEMEITIIEIWDPLEGVNRIVFGINDTLYAVVVDPVAQTYEGIVPLGFRVSIDNFFGNITTPVRFINCILQGKNEGADIEFRRFWINSTEGILGFGNPAFDKYGLEPVKEDLGQTLAVWGVDDGFYIVWPLLGPSTLRDSIGMVGDQYANPIRYVKPCEVSVGVSALKFVNKSSFHIGEYEAMFADEVDPYIAARQVYLQYRLKQIED